MSLRDDCIEAVAKDNFERVYECSWNEASSLERENFLRYAVWDHGEAIDAIANALDKIKCGCGMQKF